MHRHEFVHAGRDRHPRWNLFIEHADAGWHARVRWCAFARSMERCRSWSGVAMPTWPAHCRISRCSAARIFRCGAVGAGRAAKALNNLLSAIGLLGAAEVLSVGERFGLDPAVLLEVLNASTGRNNSTELKFSQFIFPGTFDSGFSLQLMVKDIATAVELAEQADMAVPLSLACLAAWRNAASELDRGADHTAVAQFVDRHNATRIAGHDVE